MKQLLFARLPALVLSLLPLDKAQVDAGAPDAGSAPISVTRRASPEKVRLGETFLYEIELAHRPDQRFELRMPASSGPFEVLGHTRQRTDGEKQSTTSFKIKMALFDLGKKTIPDFPLDEADPHGSGRTVVSGIEVEGIASLPADAGETGESLYDIKPPVDVPVRSYRVLWILLYVLVLAALGYALYRWTRRPSRPSIATARPLEPLPVRTLAALDALRAEDLPGQGLFREFHFRLSEILRAYVGELYQFDALECTSTELLDKLLRLRAPGLPIDELTQFVHRSDLVKFAKATAQPLDCKESLELAYRVVHQTSAPHPALPLAENAAATIS